MNEQPFPPSAPAPLLAYAQPRGRLTDWPGLLGGILILTAAASLLAVVHISVTVILRTWTYSFRISDQAMYLAVGAFTPALSFVFLILSGLVLIKRRRTARMWCLTYSWMAIVAAALRTIAHIALVVSQDAPGWIAMEQVTYAVTRLLSDLLLPIFALIWLRRPKIRQQMRDW